MFIYFSNFARSLYSSYKNHSKVLHFIESYEGIIVYSFYLSIIMGDDNGSLDWERDIDDEYFIQRAWRITSCSMQRVKQLLSKDYFFMNYLKMGKNTGL